MSWFRLTSVWSVFVAVVAVILSQFPPATEWFPVYKMKTEVSERIAIQNAIGILGYALTVDLKNIGNRPLAISKVKLNLRYPDSTQNEFLGKSYYKYSNPNQPPLNFPITTIELKPGERWAEQVLFQANFSPTDEEKLNEFRLNISQSINDKMQMATLDRYQQRPLYEASSGEVDKAIIFFNDKFNLQKGEYAGSIQFFSDSSEILLEKTIRFTIYDFHLATIKSQTKDYKYGSGIFYPVDPNKQVWAKIQEIK